MLTLTCGSNNWNDTKTRLLEDRFDLIAAGTLAYAAEKKAEEDRVEIRRQRREQRQRVYADAVGRRKRERSYFLELRRNTRRHVFAVQMR